MESSNPFVIWTQSLKYMAKVAYICKNGSLITYWFRLITLENIHKMFNQKICIIQI